MNTSLRFISPEHRRDKWRKKRRASNNVIKLSGSPQAWNIDGSCSDKLVDEDGNNKISWIKFWEIETGVSRTLCSYSDCKEEATCGGHIWVKNKGVVISPICSGCNHPSNVERQQNIDGDNSTLRKNQIVVKVEMTEDMFCAERRYSESVRECDGWVRKKCFFGRRKKSTDRNNVGWEKKRTYVRRCNECGDDISEQPENHKVCIHCYYA